MSQPSIEFFLHPPSPRLPQSTSPRLPPVSELLRDAPSLSPQLPPTTTTTTAISHPSSPIDNNISTPPQLPQIHEPIPDTRLPALTVSIPSEPFLSPCSSPSTCQTDTPHSSPTSSHLLLPPPCNTRRCRSLSSASSSSLSSLSSTLSLPCSTRRLSDPPLYSALDHHDPSMSWHQHQQQQQPSPVQCSPCSLPSTSPPQQSLPPPATISSPSCSSSSSSSYSSRQSPPLSQKGPPIVRRRRGRPPNATRHPRDNNWTFVTPTVWEVRRSPSPVPPSSQPTTTTTCIDPSSSREHSPTTNQHDITVLQWPDDPYGRNSSNTASSEAFNSTFSSTNMDTPLSMPRKKRGRKPKMQLAGNSCFVWRDLTAKKRAHRIKKTHKDDDRLALRVEGLKL